MNQIEQLIKKYRDERDKLDYLIKKLEFEISAPSGVDRPKSKRKLAANSVTSLSEKVLEHAGTDGMTVVNLLAEIKKLGATVGGDNPANSVNSTLHKSAKTGRPFVRDGSKWYLKKFAPLSDANHNGNLKKLDSDVRPS